jgi:hypothetical protein
MTEPKPIYNAGGEPELDTRGLPELKELWQILEANRDFHGPVSDAYRGGEYRRICARALELLEAQAASEFWSGIVYPEGATAEQVQAELTDYRTFMHEAAIVYDHITRGRISKVNTLASAVISEADEMFQDDLQQAIRDEIEAAQIDPDVARVLAERVRQDEKWGVQDHDDPAWLMILAEEIGEVAELVAKIMEPGDPYRHVVRALAHWGKTAQALIQDACELGTRQAVNTPGVEHEMEQSTAVGLAWLQCMTRRRDLAALAPNAPSDATLAASPRQGQEVKG